MENTTKLDDPNLCYPRHTHTRYLLSNLGKKIIKEPYLIEVILSSCLTGSVELSVLKSVLKEIFLCIYLLLNNKEEISKYFCTTCEKTQNI